MSIRQSIPYGQVFYRKLRMNGCNPSIDRIHCHPATPSLIRTKLVLLSDYRRAAIAHAQEPLNFHTVVCLQRAGDLYPSRGTGHVMPGFIVRFKARGPMPGGSRHRPRPDGAPRLDSYPVPPWASHQDVAPTEESGTTQRHPHLKRRIRF